MLLFAVYIHCRQRYECRVSGVRCCQLAWYGAYDYELFSSIKLFTLWTFQWALTFCKCLVSFVGVFSVRSDACVCHGALLSLKNQTKKVMHSHGTQSYLTVVCFWRFSSSHMCVCVIEYNLDSLRFLLSKFKYLARMCIWLWVWDEKALNRVVLTKTPNSIWLCCCYCVYLYKFSCFSLECHLSSWIQLHDRSLPKIY